MKSIIITGASRGIGASTALLLAEKYDYMAICSHSSSDALNTIKAEVEKKNCICRAFFTYDAYSHYKWKGINYAAII